MTKLEELRELRRHWALLIGEFMLAFGEVEQLSFILWRSYNTTGKPPENFKARAKWLVGRIQRDTDRADLRHQLADCFIDALRLADKRNTVAHHPMSLQFFENALDGRSSAEWAISSELNDDYITDVELERLIDQAKDIAHRIYKLWFPDATKG